MSLILDALKRSEQERRQGPTAIPSAVPPGRQATSDRIRPRWAVLGVVAIAVGLVVVSALWRAPAERPQSSSDSAPGRVEARLQPEPVAGASAPTGSAPIDNSAAPGVAVPDGGVPREARVEAVAPTVETGGSVSSSDMDEATRPATVVDIPVKVSPRVAAPDSPVAAEAGVFPDAGDRQPHPKARAPSLDSAPIAATPIHFGQLPSETRRALAPLRLDVHVYDTDPLRRFVMINGKTLGTGAEIKPGLAVGEVVREGVVLTWKGRPFLLGAGD